MTDPREQTIREALRSLVIRAWVPGNPYTTETSADIESESLSALDSLMQELADLRAQNERLRISLNKWYQAAYEQRAEARRLRAALRRIKQFADERAICHGYVGRIARMAEDALAAVEGTDAEDGS